jgi:hypothetical protein
MIGVLYVVAGYLNAHSLLTGARPDLAGVLASGVYGTTWLMHAFDAGRRGSSRCVRAMAVFWAVVIAGSVICSTFVRLDTASGAAGGGWVVAALLLVVTAPLYGLASAFSGEPFTTLTSIAVASAILTIACAVTARRLAPAA